MRKRLKMLACRNFTYEFTGAFVDGYRLATGWLVVFFVGVFDGEIA